MTLEKYKYKLRELLYFFFFCILCYGKYLIVMFNHGNNFKISLHLSRHHLHSFGFLSKKQTRNSPSSRE